MTSRHYNLIVVAHPDDESLFFASLLLRPSPIPWQVVCVTDANADGAGEKRYQQFAQAMRYYQVKDWEWLGLPDIYEQRLDQVLLASKLADRSLPQAVYTHGPIGEYMHPHHQDVSFAVHKLWSSEIPVYSVAYNCAPELASMLDAKEYQSKRYILSEIYASETMRFINMLPATAYEGFSRIPWSEVQALYRFLCGESQMLESAELPNYGWLKEFLISWRERAGSRPF